MGIIAIMVFSSQARTLKIIKLNTSSIKIGTQICKVGDTFSDEEVIYWSSPKQEIWAKYTDGKDREKKCFTREAFASRKVKTPIEYFDKINHPSVRSDEIDPIEGKNKSQFPDKRIALVIGNSNYEYQSTLSNPINDASDVTEKLVSLGFDVFLVHDVNYRDFDTALKKFRGYAQSRKYDVAIMYYCGHGIQYQGQSYLVPIDAQLNEADDLFNCIDMEDIYSKMGRTKCSTNLMFIDACRTEKGWNKKEDSQRENDPQNVGVLFSSAPNSVALDGDDRNSPFAKAFLQAIGEPASDIFSTINKISLSVENETRHKQEPHYVGKTSFSFTFIDTYANSDASVPLMEKITYYTKTRTEDEWRFKDLYAEVDGHVYQVDVPDSICIEVVEQDDFDGDGHLDALIKDIQACGGNGIGNSFFFVSYKGTGFFSISNSFGKNVWEDPVLEIWNGIKSVIIFDTNMGLNTDPKFLTNERYILKQGEAVCVETSKKNSITALQEIKASDFHNGKEEETITLSYDLDENGVMDNLYCTYWPRWDLLWFELELNGIIMETKYQAGVTRIGVLPSKTKGFYDLICNQDDIVKWNGENYDFDALVEDEEP